MVVRTWLLQVLVVATVAWAQQVTQPTEVEDSIIVFPTEDEEGDDRLRPSMMHFQQNHKPPNTIDSSSWTTTVQTPETSTHGCEIPNYPDNSYKLVHCSGGSCRLYPGQTVAANLMVNISCDPGQGHIMAVRGDRTQFSLFYCSAPTLKWSKAIPECVLPQKSTDSDIGCVLPNLHHQVKEYSLWNYCRGPACAVPPGLMVPHHAAITTVCNIGYVHAAGYNSKLTCYQGKWLEQIPHCAKSCPSLTSSNVMRAECSYGEAWNTFNCKKPTYNTSAAFTCADGYVLKPDVMYSYCSEDGVWSPQPPTCGRSA